MRKEILISILVGLTLGLVITYGFYTARLSTQTTNVTRKDDLENSPTPTPDSQLAGQLKIITPIDGSITTDPKVQVSGQTNPSSSVIVSLFDQIFVTTADDQGKFTQNLTLKPAGNIIIIQATNENGEVASESRTIILVDASVTTASGSATIPTPASTPTPTVKAGTKPTATPKPTVTPKP